MKTTLRLCFICALYFIASHAFAQSPSWLWAKSGISGCIDGAHAISTDPSGNIYVGGGFCSSTITFDTIMLTNHGIEDVFLVKYNQLGQVMWARDIGGPGNDFIGAITTDSLGGIYISGMYENDSITFGSITLINGGGTDAYLAKYDENGNAVWAKTLGGVGSYYSRGLAVDPAGDILFTGYFGGAPMVFDTITLANPGIFLAKYSPEGNVLWATAPDSSKYGSSEKVAVDASGNSYITGYFSGNHLIFGNTTLTNKGVLNIFLAKYDSDGNVQWAKSAEGPGYDYGETVTVDPSGNCYIGGEFKIGRCKFGDITLSLPDTLVNTGLFIAKYDPFGNVIWAKNGLGTYNDMASSLKADAAGYIIQSGEFYTDSLVFGNVKISNTVGGFLDIYIIKYDSYGTVLWGLNAGGTDSEYLSDMTVDASSRIYVAGGFKSPFINFGNNLVTNYGLWNAYIAAYSDGTVGIEDPGPVKSVRIFPNPAKDFVTIAVPTQCSIEIYTPDGQLINKVSSQESCTKIDLTSFASGIFLVKISTGNSVIVSKFIKI